MDYRINMLKGNLVMIGSRILKIWVERGLKQLLDQLICTKLWFFNAFGQEFNLNHNSVEEEAKPQAEGFYEMMDTTNFELWDVC